MSKPISRRGFIKQLNCAAVGTSAILNTLINLRLANSLSAQGAPDNKAFAVDRLAAGSRMLRDIWWTAWVTSAPTPNGRPSR